MCYIESMEGGGKARFVQVERKWFRHILRCGTVKLLEEIGRLMGIYIYDIGERSIYVQCITGEVDEVKHILLKCSSVGREIEREMLVKQIQHY